jgi:ABC-type antimicrobial peptide transport system permease subunit
MDGSGAERANPWLLLHRTFPDGAVPVIGDSTSLTYVFHAGIGDEIVVPGEDGTPVLLRVVGALSHSMLQSELLISERQFERLFPRREGYRFFLMDAPAERQAEVTALLEDRLADAGFDVQSSVERLRGYERVERTYLSTFQTLGGLGLVIGTLGLGAVLLRNVLERRRELALLRAVGFRRTHVRGLVLAESLLMLGAGVAAGAGSAMVAVAPALWARGGGGPGWTDTLLLLGVVIVAGIVSSSIAARVATGAAPVSALRSE